MDKPQKNYQITKVTSNTGQDLFLEDFIALLSFSGLSGMLKSCFKKISSLGTKNLNIAYVPELRKFYPPHVNFQ